MARYIGRSQDYLGKLKDDAKVYPCFCSKEELEQGREMAIAGHRLNVLAAVFFPVVTIASIFGMSLKHGLEDVFSPILFWVVLLIGIVSGFVLKSSIIKSPTPATARPKELGAD